MRHIVTTLALLIILALPGTGKAQKSLAEAPKDLGLQIADSALKQQKKKIAVIPFRSLDGLNSALGNYLAEELVTELFKVGGLEIVERTMLDRILDELKLGRSGIIDSTSAKQVGKIAGVDAVVTGTVTDFPSFAAVNCRLIDVQTGRVFAAASTKIVKDRDVITIIDNEPRQNHPAEPIGGEGRSQHETHSAPVNEVRSGGFIFRLNGCSRSGGSLTCDLMVTSERKDTEIVLFGSHRFAGDAIRSRVIDERGDEFVAAEIKLGETVDQFQIRTVLISGVPTRAMIDFEGVPEKISRLAILDLAFSNAEGQLRVPSFRSSGRSYGTTSVLHAQFRGISIAAN